MKASIPPKNNRQLPHPWFFTRLKRDGESDEFLSAIDAHLRNELSECPRCSGIYQQTGLVAAECDVCGVIRGWEWLQQIERLAAEAPILPARSSVLAEANQSLQAALAKLPVAR